MMRVRWILVCLALTLLPGVTRAGDDDDDRRGFAVDWYAIGTGGGVSTGSGWILEGTAGQTALGNSTGYPGLIGGYWAPFDSDWYDDDDLVARTYLERQGAIVGPQAAASPFGEGPIVEFALAPVFPNPSSGVTRIAWAVPVHSNVRLTVLDVQGRLVTTLADGDHAPGRYQVTWNNLTTRGVAPGMYFVRLESPARTFIRRVVLAH